MGREEASAFNAGGIMSSNWSKKISYKCFNDCRMEGCPGHILQVQYSNTVDIVNVHVAGERIASFDDNQFEALLKAALAKDVMPYSTNARMIEYLEGVLKRMKGKE